MPLSTELPVGDLYEIVGNFRLNSDGPPTTGRLGLPRLQEILLSSTAIIGARFLAAEGRLTAVEALAGRVPGIDTRLQTVEAFTGVGNTGLAVDVGDLRNTRYWGRPGEALRTWTADVGGMPSAVTPLAVGGAYSVAPGPGGKALRITGAGTAGPDALVRVDKDRTLEFNFTLSRPINDPVAANNTPQLRMRTFNAAGEDTGSLVLPSAPVVFADGVVTFTVLISRTPGVGTVDLPDGAIDVRPAVGNLGTTGALNIYGAEYRDRVTLATLIRAGGLVSTIPDTALFGFENNGASQKITFKDFKKMFDPDTYLTFETVQVDTTPHVLRGADADLVSIEWQSAGHDIAACATGHHASLTMKTPSVKADQGGIGHIGFKKGGSPKGISFVADVACPVTLAITRLTRNYQKYKLFGDDVLANWPDQAVDERYYYGMRDALNGAQGDGSWGQVRFFFDAGHSAENNAINLAQPALGKTLDYRPGTTGIATKPYTDVKGGGIDAYVETGLTTDDLKLTISSYFALAMASSATIHVGGALIGISDNYHLSPNATSTEAAAAAGGSRDAFKAPPGSMVAMNRKGQDDYDTFASGALVKTFTRPKGSMPTGTLKLLAVPASSGVGRVSPLGLTLAMWGEAFNDTGNIQKLYNWFKPVQDIKAVIRAELAANGGAA